MNTGRNINLHPLFRAPWEQDESELGSEMEIAPQVVVPQGNTAFDPLLGTGWDRYLDELGAKSPRGARIGGGADLPYSPKPLTHSLFALKQLGAGKAGKGIK